MCHRAAAKVATGSLVLRTKVFRLDSAMLVGRASGLGASCSQLALTLEVLSKVTGTLRFFYAS